MRLNPLPRAFVSACDCLTWEEAIWGVENGWADWRILTDLATNALLRSDDNLPEELELAGMVEGNEYDALDLAKRVEAARPRRSKPTPASDPWRYLALSYAYENRHEFDDPLAIVDELYADFGYPPGMASFVRYMPAIDGYDPEAHSATENRERIYANWGEYLDGERRRLQSRGA